MLRQPVQQRSGRAADHPGRVGEERREQQRIDRAKDRQGGRRPALPGQAGEDLQHAIAPGARALPGRRPDGIAPPPDRYIERGDPGSAEPERQHDRRMAEELAQLDEIDAEIVVRLVANAERIVVIRRRQWAESEDRPWHSADRVGRGGRVLGRRADVGAIGALDRVAPGERSLRLAGQHEHQRSNRQPQRCCGDDAWPPDPPQQDQRQQRAEDRDIQEEGLHSREHQPQRCCADVEPARPARARIAHDAGESQQLKRHRIHIVTHEAPHIQERRRDQQVDRGKQRRGAPELAPDQAGQHHQHAAEQRHPQPGGGVAVTEQKEDQRTEMIQKGAVQQRVVDETFTHEEPP